MCELLGMSANVPTDICFSFTGLVYYLLCFSLEKITQRRFALK